MRRLGKQRSIENTAVSALRLGDEAHAVANLIFEAVLNGDHAGWRPFEMAAPTEVAG